MNMQSITAQGRPLWSGLVLCFASLLGACEQRSDDPLPATALSLAQPCDVRSGCVAEVEDFALALSMGPEVRPLKPFAVDVEHRRGPPIDSMTVAFDMKNMDMGSSRYRLIETGDSWHANVTLPVCMSGRSDWIADFEVLAAGRRYQFQVPFALEK